MLRNDSDAEEVLQDCFLKAYKALNNFNGDAKFSTWFYRIVYNTALTKLSSKKRKIESEMTTPAGTYNNYLYFEKNARNYRKDQVFFKPGIGVLKYKREKAKLGVPIIKTEQILTLVSYHIE